MEKDMENLENQLNNMTINEIKSNHKVPSKYTTRKDIISYIVNGPPPPKEDTYPRIKEITPELFEKVNGKIFHLSMYASIFCGFVQVVGHTKSMIKVRRLEYKSKGDQFGCDYWIDKEWFDSNAVYDKKGKIICSTDNYYLYENKEPSNWNKDFPYSLSLRDISGYKQQDINTHYYTTSHD